jgi:hypothetical protein
MDWIELILGTILGAIIAIPISYFFLLKGTQKIVEYEIKSFNLITETISEKISSAPSLKIRYGTEINSEDVKILTSSIIKIENTGFIAIEKKDVIPDEPVQIVVKDNSKLYFARMIDYRGKGNDFETNVHDEKYVDISFHHLNRKDGIKVQVFHSGKSSEAIEIRGNIVGGPEIKEKPEWKKSFGQSFVVPIATGCILILLVSFFGQQVFTELFGTTTGLIGVVLIFLIFSVACIVIGAMTLGSWIYKSIFNKYFNKTNW